MEEALIWGTIEQLSQQGAEHVTVMNVDTAIDQRTWRHGNQDVWDILQRLEDEQKLLLSPDPIRPWSTLITVQQPRQ